MQSRSAWFDFHKAEGFGMEEGGVGMRAPATWFRRADDLERLGVE